MGAATIYQPTLLLGMVGKFPSTRYQGSKAKLANWIWEQVSGLDFLTCLDAFGGTGAVGYRLKQEGKKVTYNDYIRFNYHIGLALIENSHTQLNPEEIEWILQRHQGIAYHSFVEKTFAGIYFTDEENTWIDQTIANIRRINDPYKFAIAFFSLCQSCIVKRPYNLFHRKNLYIRLADVERSFGNKTSWDRPFDEWFRIFVQEVNEAVFDNGQRNAALNMDAADAPNEYDLVYIDTPYISKTGSSVDYHWYYHFLEGLAMYDSWGEMIEYSSKHLRLKPRQSEWVNKRKIHAAFDSVFRRHKDSTIVVSYRSDGIPSERELLHLLQRYKRHVTVRHYGKYQYVLSTNNRSREILLIGT